MHTLKDAPIQSTDKHILKDASIYSKMHPYTQRCIHTLIDASIHSKMHPYTQRYMITLGAPSYKVALKLYNGRTQQNCISVIAVL